MKILGIESSCDDTSVALLDCHNNGCTVVIEKTASQIDLHQKYGGVVPELAGRAHAEKIIPLIESVLEHKIRPDAVVVTAGPGLITGLLVGVEAAKTLSYVWNIPLVAVNHLEGHIHSVEIGNKQIQYPALALIVSGGHTELIHIPTMGQYIKLGATKDDAAGECFDKVAKILGLEYPGGPAIAKLAEKGNHQVIDFPRPMMNQNNFDFSFSGLKTSALYWLQKNKLSEKNGCISIADFCASFQQAIVDVLISKTIQALEQYSVCSVILGGGVSANQTLRDQLKEAVLRADNSCKICFPELKYAMDNAAMIALAGYYRAKKGPYTDWREITADPNWQITG